MASFRNAFRAACIAIDCAAASATVDCWFEDEEGGETHVVGDLGAEDVGGGGGGGGAFEGEDDMGGLGAAALGGIGGTDGGADGGSEGGIGSEAEAVEEGGGGGGGGTATFEGFRAVGGGAGLGALGGGGGALGGRSKPELGLLTERNGVFRRPAGIGFGGCSFDSVDGADGDGRETLNLAIEGGLGAVEVGSLATALLEVSGSEFEELSCSDPRSSPIPVFLSLGMPPARIPPSCGTVGSSPPPPSRPESLLLLTLFAAADPGTGGARPTGGLPIPGTGGALVVGAPPAKGPIEGTSDALIWGADLSFVTAFFNFVPFVIAPSRALYS